MARKRPVDGERIPGAVGEEPQRWVTPRSQEFKAALMGAVQFELLPDDWETDAIAQHSYKEAVKRLSDDGVLVISEKIEVRSKDAFTPAIEALLIRAVRAVNISQKANRSPGVLPSIISTWTEWSLNREWLAYEMVIERQSTVSGTELPAAVLRVDTPLRVAGLN